MVTGKKIKDDSCDSNIGNFANIVFAGQQEKNNENWKNKNRPGN